MAIKYPAKLQTLVHERNATALHAYWTKHQHKTYCLSSYAHYVMQHSDMEFFSQACLEWPALTPEIEHVFVQSGLSYAFETNNVQTIEKIIHRGYDLVDFSPMVFLSLYFRELQSEQLYQWFVEADPEHQVTPAVTTHSILARVDWSRVNDKKIYFRLSSCENLMHYVDTIGKENFSQEEKDHLLYSQMNTASPQIIAYLSTLGASIYAQQDLKALFFRDKVMFPQKGSYGQITLTGRRNLTSLMHAGDKHPANEVWRHFIDRSLNYSHNGEVAQHLQEMIACGDLDLRYFNEANELNFWKLFITLETGVMSELLDHYDISRCQGLIKPLIEYAPEKIEVLLDSGMDVSRFLASDYATSLHREAGFVKQRKLPEAVSDPMRQALARLKSYHMARSLTHKLHKDDNSDNLPARSSKI